MDAAGGIDRESSDRISEVFKMLELMKKTEQAATLWEAGQPVDLADRGRYVTRISNTSQAIPEMEGHAKLE
jgi:hypothetical protein